MFAENLMTYLLADTELKRFVGNQIYPLVIPQNAPLPAIAYQEITASPEHTFESGQEGLVRTQYQFSTYADTYKEAVEAAEKLRIALNIVNADLSGLRVSARIVDRRDEYTDRTRTPSVSMDFEFWYREEV